MNQMYMISKFGIFASVLLVLSLFTIFSLSEAAAIDAISVSAAIIILVALCFLLQEEDAAHKAAHKH